MKEQDYDKITQESDKILETLEQAELTPAEAATVCVVSLLCLTKVPDIARELLEHIIEGVQEGEAVEAREALERKRLH